MLRFAALLAVVLLFSSGFAQEFSSESVLETEDYFRDYIGTIGSEHIVTSSHKKIWYLNRLSADMSQLISQKLELGQGKSEMELLDIAVFNEEIVVLVALQDKKQKQTTYYLQSIDPATLLQTGQLKEIGSVAFDKKPRKEIGKIVLSSDSNILLTYLKLPCDLKSEVGYLMQVWDGELNMLWHKTHQLPYIDKLYDLNQALVGSNGNVYLCGKVKNPFEERIASNKDIDYMHIIAAITSQGDSMYIHEVGLPETHISSLNIATKDDGDLFVCGLFGYEDSKGTKGIFMMKIDSQTQELIKLDQTEFSEEFISEQWNEESKTRLQTHAHKKRRELHLRNFKIREMIPKADGGFVVLTEKYFDWIATRGRGDNEIREHMYCRNEMIVFNLNSKGKLEWHTWVPKVQVSTDDNGYYSSYALGVGDSKLYILYNDEISNLEETVTSDMSNFSGGHRSGADASFGVILATINGKGEVKRQLLYNYSNNEGLCVPIESGQINDHSIFMYFEHKEGWRFASFKW